MENTSYRIISKNSQLFFDKIFYKPTKLYFNEIKILKQLDHKNIIKYVDSYQSNNCYHLIVEYFRGVPLNKKENLSLKEKMAVLMKIVDTLIYIHHKGVIHCDLKESNILIDNNNEIKLIDFGISIFSNENYEVNYGTLFYAAKEQILKEKLTFATDIYAFGILAYKFITSNYPYKDIKTKLLEPIPKIMLNLDGIENDLTLLISKCTAKNPDYRYQTAEDLKKDLQVLYSKIRY